MADTHFDRQVRAARPTPPNAYYDMLDETLDRLTYARRRTGRRWVVPAVAAAAALIAITLAGPPVARAAASFFERLFAGRAASIERELAQPADQRVQEMAGSIQAQDVYYQTYTDAPLATGDIRAAVKGVSTYKSDEGGLRLMVTIAYAEWVEGFDPAWLDYTLTVGGRDIPMNMDGGVESYRAESLVCDGDALAAPWQVIDGQIESYVSFNMGALSLERPTDMRVSARLHTRDAQARIDKDIGPMELAFTFDPAVALAQEQERIQAHLPVYDDYLRGEQERYSILAAQAVPVGARCETGEQVICVDEMAVMDGRIVFTVSAAGKADYSIYRKAEMMVTGVRIDGMSMPWAGSEETLSIGESSIAVARDIPLARDVRKLPEQSLIYVAFDSDVSLDYKPGADASVVFRYNWTQKTVALPADEGQARAWRDEEAALAQTMYREPYASTVFRPDTPQTKGGATLTIDEIDISSMMTVRFSCAGRKIDGNDYDREYAVTVDGLPVREWGGYGIESFTCVMPVYHTEIGDVITLSISIPIAFEDGGKETFEFALTLNMDDAEGADMRKR